MKTTSMSIKPILALVLLGVSASAHANTPVAQDAEEAQLFLGQMLQSGAIAFTIGNDITERRDYGLKASVSGNFTSYQKKMFGRWAEYRNFRKPLWVEFKNVNFGRIGKDGKYDPCVTSLDNIEVVGAWSLEVIYTFPPDGLYKESFGETIKWTYQIEQDPKQFAGPYLIDWRRATFDRSRRPSLDLTDFLIKTGERIPYAQLSVYGDGAGDYVENAIRVLQLSCAGQK